MVNPSGLGKGVPLPIADGDHQTRGNGKDIGAGAVSAGDPADGVLNPVNLRTAGQELKSDLGCNVAEPFDVHPVLSFQKVEGSTLL